MNCRLFSSLGPFSFGLRRFLHASRYSELIYDIMWYMLSRACRNHWCKLRPSHFTYIRSWIIYFSIYISSRHRDDNVVLAKHGLRFCTHVRNEYLDANRTLRNDGVVIPLLTLVCHRRTAKSEKLTAQYWRISSRGTRGMKLRKKILISVLVCMRLGDLQSRYCMCFTWDNRGTTKIYFWQRITK